MLKYIALLVAVIISLAFYEKYSYSILDEEQKKAVIEKENASLEKLTLEAKASKLAQQLEDENNEVLSNTPWGDINIEQYGEKFMIDKLYLWFFLLVIPTLFFNISKTVLFSILKLKINTEKAATFVASANIAHCSEKLKVICNAPIALAAPAVRALKSNHLAMLD